MVGTFPQVGANLNGRRIDLNAGFADTVNAFFIDAGAIGRITCIWERTRRRITNNCLLRLIISRATRIHVFFRHNLVTRILIAAVGLTDRADHLPVGSYIGAANRTILRLTKIVVAKLFQEQSRNSNYVAIALIEKAYTFQLFNKSTMSFERGCP